MVRDFQSIYDDKKIEKLLISVLAKNEDILMLLNSIPKFYAGKNGEKNKLVQSLMERF